MTTFDGASTAAGARLCSILLLAGLIGCSGDNNPASPDGGTPDGSTADASPPTIDCGEGTQGTLAAGGSL